MPIRIRARHLGEHITRGVDYGWATLVIPTIHSDPWKVFEHVRDIRYQGMRRGKLKKKEFEIDPGKSLGSRLRSYIIALRFGYSEYEAEIIADYGWSLNIVSYYDARRKRLGEVLLYMADHMMNPKDEAEFRVAAQYVAEGKGHLTLWDILEEGESP